MSVFYSTQFNGMTGGTIATDWTATAGTRWVIAAASQQGSDTFQCSGGAGAQSCYKAALLAGSKEDVDVILLADRQSGGLYDFQVDFNLGASGARTQGFSTRIRRTSNATNAVEIQADVLGGVAGSATGSLSDGFAWVRRVQLIWSGDDALIRVSNLQQDYTWAAVYERLVLGAGITGTSGYVGLHAVATTGRVYLDFMRVAIGPAAYCFLTRPFKDVTPFRVSSDGTHRLRVRGVCGNTPASIQGRFIPDGVDESTIDWQTIDSAPSTTFDGEIATTTEGSGTIQIRPSDNPTAVDQIEDCIVCLVIACAGQSNAAGRAVANGGFTPSGDIGYALIWPSNVTPSNPTGNQYWRASTSGEADFKWMTQSSTGTPWPECAAQLSARLALHVAWIGHAEGSTTLITGTPSWADAGTDWERFEINLARSGITGVNYVVWWQGEGDANADGTEDAYSTALIALRNRIASVFDDQDFIMLPCPLGQIAALTITTDALARTKIDPIRAAIVRLCKDYGAWFKMGGIVSTYDLAHGVGADSLHFVTSAAVTAAATAWADAIEEAYTGDTSIRGPVLQRCSWSDQASFLTIVSDFDRPIAKAGADASLLSTKVLVNGSEVAHTNTIAGNRLTTTLGSATTAALAVTVRVFYFTGNQAADGGTTAGSYLVLSGGAELALPFAEVPSLVAGSRSRDSRSRSRP